MHKNWVRAYTVECPEEGSWRTALRIFVKAMHSLLGRTNERELLRAWIRIRGWRDQAEKQEGAIKGEGRRQNNVLGAMPMRLEAPTCSHGTGTNAANK